MEEVAGVRLPGLHMALARFVEGMGCVGRKRGGFVQGLEAQPVPSSEPWTGPLSGFWRARGFGVACLPQAFSSFGVLRFGILRFCGSSGGGKAGDWETERTAEYRILNSRIMKSGLRMWRGASRTDWAHAKAQSREEEEETGLQDLRHGDGMKDEEGNLKEGAGRTVRAFSSGAACDRRIRLAAWSDTDSVRGVDDLPITMTCHHDSR